MMSFSFYIDVGINLKDLDLFFELLSALHTPSYHLADEMLFCLLHYQHLISANKEGTL